MPTQLYAWAAGHNVPLLSLRNVEEELYPHNRRMPTGIRRQVGIRSPILDEYPVRFVKGSGREGGGGIVNHEWNMVATTYALDYILDTYLTTGIDAAMTIYTRLHKHNTFGRYNAYLVNPSSTEGDIEYLRQNVVQVRWRFRRLVAL